MYNAVDLSKVDMVYVMEGYLDTPLMGGGSLELNEIAMEGIGGNVKNWIKKKFLSLGEAIGRFITWIKTKFLKLMSLLAKQKPVDPSTLQETRNVSLSQSNKNESTSTEPKFQKLTNLSNVNTSQSAVSKAEDPNSSSNAKPSKKPVVEISVPKNVLSAMDDIRGKLVIYESSVAIVKFSVKSMTTDTPDDDEQRELDRISLRHLDKAADAKSLISAIDKCETAMTNESNNMIRISTKAFSEWANIANKLVDTLTKIKRTIDETIPYLGYSDKETKLANNLRDYMKHAESYYNTISKVLPLATRIFTKYRTVVYK